MPGGDRTGWLGREDSNLCIGNLCPVGFTAVVLCGDWVRAPLKPLKPLINGLRSGQRCYFVAAPKRSAA